MVIGYKLLFIRVTMYKNPWTMQVFDARDDDSKCHENPLTTQVFNARDDDWFYR